MDDGEVKVFKSIPMHKYDEFIISMHASTVLYNNVLVQYCIVFTCKLFKFKIHASNAHYLELLYFLLIRIILTRPRALTDTIFFSSTSTTFTGYHLMLYKFTVYNLYVYVLKEL